MKRLILIPEDVYFGLMSASHSGDPFDTQIVKKSQKIGEVLTNKRMASDTSQMLYNDEIKRIKTLKNIKPEAAIERETNVDALPINTEPISKNVPQKPVQITEPPTQIPEKLVEAEKEPEQIVDLNETQDSIETQQPPDVNVESDEYESDPGFKYDSQVPTSPYDRRVDRIAKRFLKRQSEFPINEKGQVRRPDGSYVIGSHLDRIVLYMLDKKAYARAPNGYNDFIRAANQVPDLASLLNLKNIKRYQARFEAASLRAKSQKGSGVFKFRPSLWKRF